MKYTVSLNVLCIFGRKRISFEIYAKYTPPMQAFSGNRQLNHFFVLVDLTELHIYTHKRRQLNKKFIYQKLY